MVTDYKRKVTHTQYKHGNRKVRGRWLRGHLNNQITDNKFILTKELQKLGYYPDASDKFLYKPQYKTDFIEPLLYGGLFLILFIAALSIHINSKDKTIEFLSLVLFFLSGVVFHIIYYFTMPKREFILNRLDGTITFPGVFWEKNFTMPIEKVIFSMTGPGVQGLGAFKLQIIRPDWFYSKFPVFIKLGNNCYENLSFILWYMDKNRPLPTGNAFDEYRQTDFERRKNEGFPKPLFTAHFKTPEATPEQQKQREQIGGW